MVKCWKKIAQVTRIGFLAALIGEGTCITKNLVQLDPEANLEYKITRSDEKQANYLKSMLDAPLDDFSNLEFLDRHLVPSESMLLTLAFYSYSLTNLALSDNKYREMAQRYIDRAIQKSLQPRIRDTFASHSGKPIEEKAEENVLYLGHLNLMMGAYALVSGDDKYQDSQKRITDALYDGFLASPSRHLQSYHQQQWPADNAVGLASLYVYDRLYDEDHSAAIKAWTKWTQRHLDKDGLMPSHISIKTSESDAEPRGCATAYSIPFIYIFDLAFAQELYGNFRRTMFKEIAGIPFARESLREDYPATVDSGPIILDAGVVASAFAIGAAKISNDRETFTKLSYAAEALTFPYEISHGKGYLANVSLGEAVLLYGRTLRPWI